MTDKNYLHYFLHLIADYGVGDPAFGEVIQKLKMLKQNLEIYPTSVPPFSTLATGFWIAQYALYNTFPGLAVYANCAPRRDNKDKRVDNSGESLIWAELDNSVPVIAVNSGYNLSFIRDHIRDFRFVKVQNKGSQFRSRDFYPEAVVKIIAGDKSILGDKLSTKIIPSIPRNRIASIDGYGNMKTTIRRSEVKFKEGENLKILIGKVSRKAYFVEGNFAVREGELALGRGSSGGEDRFLELFLRGGSAWELFQKPKVGEKISFSSF